MDLAKAGLDAIDKALNLYNKILDRIVPWKDFQESVDNLDKFRRDYSTEASQIIGDLKTKMMDGMDQYFMSTQSIYEWCGLALRLLKTYKKIMVGEMNESKFKIQRKLLVQLLSVGVEKMEKAQNELEASSTSFNDSAGKLDALNRRLKTDFDEKSEYFETQKSRIRKTAYMGAAPFGLFGLAIAAGVTEGKIIPELIKKMESIKQWYEGLTVTIKNSLVNIDDVKVKFQTEIRDIGNLKTNTEATQIYVEAEGGDGAMMEIIKESVDELIKNCNEYRMKHKKIE